MENCIGMKVTVKQLSFEEVCKHIDPYFGPPHERDKVGWKKFQELPFVIIVGVSKAEYTCKNQVLICQAPDHPGEFTACVDLLNLD